MRFIYSGDYGRTKMKEKAAILGTPAALHSLGEIMMTLDKNTALKAQNGFSPIELIKFPAMRLMLLPDDNAKLEITVPPSSLTLSAGKATFQIMGQSLVNSYAKGDKPGHRVAISAGDENTVMDDPRRILEFKSTPPETPITPSEDFSGNNSGRPFA